MNDDLYLEYMMNMVGQAPDQAELKRKQAMVDALRKNAMTPMQGQMVGNHYVAPGIGQALAQLGQAYMANRGQEGVDTKVRSMNADQANRLNQIRDELRKRRMGTPSYSGDATAVGYDSGYDFGGQ